MGSPDGSPDDLRANLQDLGYLTQDGTAMSRYDKEVFTKMSEGATAELQHHQEELFETMVEGAHEELHQQEREVFEHMVEGAEAHQREGEVYEKMVEGAEAEVQQQAEEQPAGEPQTEN